MNRRWRIGHVGFLAVLVALVCSLSGCSLTGATGSTAATTRHPPASATGTWAFKDRYTLEVLHLHQSKGGAVAGSGNSAVTVAAGKVDHSAITVHSGHADRGRLNLALYIAQVDWGSGLTVVETLHCTIAARALHCRMDLPLYQNVRNVKQDFSRRA